MIGAQINNSIERLWDWHARLMNPADLEKHERVTMRRDIEDVLDALAAVAELVTQWRRDAACWMPLLTPPGVPNNHGDDVLRERIKRLNACADALAAIRAAVPESVR